MSLKLKKTKKFAVWSKSNSKSNSLCELNECIPSVYNDEKREIRCNTYNSLACFEPSETDVKFYRAIGNWNILKDNIDTFMDRFKTLLNEKYTNNEEGFKDLFNGLYSFTEREKEEVFKTSNIVKGDNFVKCGDINYAFSISCRKDSKTIIGKEYRIFHIALHSEKSKYESLSRDNIVTRSMWSCAYYKKSNSDDQGTGALHYKIDNQIGVEKANSKNCPKKNNEVECPFKLFKNRGYIFENNTDNFENIGIVPLEKRDGINQLHNMIYNWFIFFWNENIHAILVGHAPNGGRYRRKSVKKYRRKSVKK